LAIVLVGVFAGLAIIFATHWRLGSTTLGAAITIGAFFRLVLGKKAGLLVVRSTAVDVLLLAIVGIGVIALAWLVPAGRG
jgi:hypothetical protein